MSYNGSGTFVINTAGQPVVSGTVISSTAFNALTADLATGLSTAITKDGQTTPTANIPMGNNKITGLAVGTAATDAANLSQVQSTAAKLVNSVSGADTITGTMSPTLAAYAAGQMFYFVAAGDNTGAVTLNLDGLGAKSVTRDGSVALAAGDIKSGEVVVVVYDGTRFQVVSQLNSAGNATFANVSITSALNVGGVATFSGGTANGVTYLNASKALTSGSALVFDGTNLGIGTSSPAYKLDVSGAIQSSVASGNGAIYVNNSSLSGKFWTFIPETSSGESNLLLYYGGTGAGTKLTLTNSGNLGLGVTPAGWTTYKAMQFSTTGAIAAASGGDMVVGNNYYYDGANKYLTTAPATYYYQYNGAHSWHNAPSGTAGTTATFTQAMTLDASGRLGIGQTSPNVSLHIENSSSIVKVFSSGNNAAYTQYQSNGNGKFFYIGQDNSTGASFGVGGYSTVLWNDGAYPIVFATNNAERARIDSSGNFLFGTTMTPANLTATSTTVGVGINPNGYGVFVRNNDTPLYVNRLSADGVLVQFIQAGTEEGSISVSGNTVSYNAFAGSHWSQLQDGSKPDILRGTVMESINELCEWPDEQNERLPKAKISDTAGSKKVYGVFMAWDNDWTETNDMYVTAVGAFICRVNGSVTVEEGDLLESNGDGTARVQADDIIRSSTIGKVTSTVKTHQYDDGSYCVPTVLYCG